MPVLDWPPLHRSPLNPHLFLAFRDLGSLLTDITANLETSPALGKQLVSVSSPLRDRSPLQPAGQIVSDEGH